MPRPHAPTRTLRERSDLDQLRRQAKLLLKRFRAGAPDAVAEVRAHYHDADAATFALHDAQLVLARAYGFDSWPKLKARVDGVTVKRLADAVRAGAIAEVRAILATRPELVHRDMAENNEHRALHYAVLARLPEMVRLLMQHGADARKGIYPHRDATSALTLATDRGDDGIVAIIREEELRRQEDRVAPATTGSTGNAGSNRRSPARVSVPAAHVDMPSPETLLEMILYGDRSEALAMLDAHPMLIRASHPDGWTPLHAAAGALDEPMVGWLLERNAPVNQRAKGWSPLDAAASGRGWKDSDTPERFMVIARMLRAHGAELAAVSAVAMGEADWVRARHAEGALINATSLHVFEPFAGLLSAAVRHDRADMLVLLLDLGLDPDERVPLDNMDDDVFTQCMPLHHCAASGKLAMAEMLLRRGASPNGHVYTSGSPIYAAYAAHDRAMIDLLERHGGVLDAGSAGRLHQTARARQMFADAAAGRLPEGTIEPGQSLAVQLLEGAASSGPTEIVAMALEHIDWTRDDPRWYWMMWETLGAHLDCLRLILARCDPNVRGTYGRRVLHDVAGSDDNVSPAQRMALATQLLDAGARLDVRDDLLASTPLGWACRWGHVELVELFRQRGADAVEADAEPWATPRAWATKMTHDAVLARLPHIE